MSSTISVNDAHHLGHHRGPGRCGHLVLLQLPNCAERLICVLSVSGRKAFVAAISPRTSRVRRYT
jgi:hypothetical protein